MTLRMRGWLLAVGLALSGVPGWSWSGAAPVPQERLHHSVWTPKDGAPSDVWAISQTQDGWMWFGGPSGLYRFDGVTFERVDTEPSGSTRSTAVSALMALPSGELVIGYRNGGVAIVTDGRARAYHEADGFDGGTVFDLTVDARGALWVATRTGLHRYAQGRWQRVGAEAGLLDRSTVSVAVDPDGRLWVSTSTGVLQRGVDDARFTQVLQTDGPVALVVARDGRVWCELPDILRVCPSQQPARAGNPVPRSSVSNTAVFDRDGLVWLLQDHGLGRTILSAGQDELTGWSQPRPGVEQIVGLDGIGSKTMFEDRAGSLWISTVDGALHQLRAVPISSLLTDGSTYLGGGALVAGSAHEIWMPLQSSMLAPFENDGLWRLDAKPHRVMPERIKTATAAHLSKDGTLTVASEGWLWRGRDDRLTRDVELPSSSTSNAVLWIAEDPDTRGIWVSQYGLGLFLRRGAEWERNGGVAALPQREPAAMTSSDGGSLWLGYADGRLFELRSRKVIEVYGPSGTADVGVGAIRVINMGTRVVVGGDRGVGILQNGGLRLLTPAQPGAFEGITGIAQTDNGDVWLNANLGLVRLAASDLQRALAQPAAPIAARIFDKLDGYAGDGANKHPFGNTLVKSSDGRLWFSGVSQPGWMDPAGILPDAAPSTLTLTAFMTPAGPVDPRGAAVLQAGTRDLQIDYTTPNFVHPERERYRYRLVGLDDAWTQAGGRRQAFFTNVPPGHYRIEVQSRHDGNDWSASPVTLQVDIPPTFLQSRLFAAMCVLAGLAVLVFLLRLREQQIRRREYAKHRERLAERERIARELHDTLLQSTQGLMFKVQAALTRLRAGDDSTRLLEESLDDADRLMIEGRDRIQELRTQVSDSRHVEAQLQMAGARLAAEHGTDFRMTVDGAARDLRPVFADEASRIALEALANAFRHAKPRHVETELVLGRDEFRLRIRDDGVGISGEALEQARTEGHWGMRGMRERAARVGGKLEVWTASGAGTEIEFVAPSSAAYVDGAISRWAWAKRRDGARRGTADDSKR